jgi:hypothetical protein
MPQPGGASRKRHKNPASRRNLGGFRCDPGRAFGARLSSVGVPANPNFAYEFG